MNNSIQELDFRLGGSSKMYNDFEDFRRLFLLTTSFTVSFLHITRVLSLVSPAKPHTSASPLVEIWQLLTGASGLNTAKQQPIEKKTIWVRYAIREAQ